MVNFIRQGTELKATVRPTLIPRGQKRATIKIAPEDEERMKAIAQLIKTSRVTEENGNDILLGSRAFRRDDDE